MDGPLIEHAIEWPTSFPLISEVLDAEGNWNLSNVSEFIPEEIIQSILSSSIQPSNIQDLLSGRILLMAGKT